MTRLDEARQILEAFGFDKARTNVRAARTLLALTQLDEQSQWADAVNPMLGVRAILDWIRERLGIDVAENTRETYRRQTLHQFRDAGFVIYNDDDPARPTNSSANNYRINPEALKVIRLYGTPRFDAALSDYLAVAPGLLEKYQRLEVVGRMCSSSR